ncbi:MAG: 1-(5-phosphoribosyl)-5-[(5-phosphoribosylamino)methylideneamino]imidazole-4-carboxamide isomerase [Chloroflexi bacterium]|nr:1-(5-phosphoribosyl)-5-[(5-phosphoribosylamino)methylideneamino]imidazole-4-carboxamide isomerase [Chloroflexota bacterium]MCY3938205.1 1-(5-phosphoribosyl)-5-[(5-phosphoribosylamino)methylideneamino]imidazole-4-carboxamide isomerase [Chloroflexota bacterium]
MDIYPAVDIKDGKCVNLVRGEFDQSTVFDDSPVHAALGWAEAGASWIHVVDLDGARAGRPVNGEIVRQIVESTGCPIQLGGGIRSLRDLEDVLALDVERAVLGTAAVENLELVKAAACAFPGRVAVGLDTRAGKVATHAWTSDTEILATDLAVQVAAAGAAALIHTDIQRDGMLSGANVDASAALAESVDIPVIVSGGVSSLDDVRRTALARLGGVIIGRALYTGAIDLKSVIEAVESVSV